MTMYTPDPDAMTPRESAIVERWNAAYPADAVDVSCYGYGKLFARVYFDTEGAWRARWSAIVQRVDKEVAP